MEKYFFIAYFAVFITAISQIFLKKGSLTEKTHFLSIFLNLRTIFGYFLLFSVTIMNLYVYTKLPLKYSIIITPFTFIIVGVLSWFVLKEKISKQQLIGYIIITSGVVVYSIK